METWGVSFYTHGLAQPLGRERGIQFTLGESTNEWSLVPPDSIWSSEKVARPKLLYIWTFLGKFGGGDVLRLTFWDHLDFGGISIALTALPSFYRKLSRVFLYAVFISPNSKEGHFMYNSKKYIKFVFKVKLPLPSSQMMDFVFLLLEGQESEQCCIFQSSGPFPPSYPTALSVSYARNHLVPCSDLHCVKHNSGSLCALSFP